MVAGFGENAYESIHKIGKELEVFETLEKLATKRAGLGRFAKEAKGNRRYVNWFRR